MKYIQILYKLGVESPEALQQNKLKLSKLFKVSTAKIEELFKRRPVVLMARVEFERAKRLYQELKRHGIPCEAKPVPTATSIRSTSVTATVSEPRNPAKIRERLSHVLNSWFGGRVWLMLMVLVVIPLVAIAIPIANVALIGDYHVAYIGKRNGALCVDFKPFILGQGQGKSYEKQLFKDYLRRYKAQTNPEFVRNYGYQACRVDYLVQIGNVGHKPVQSISLSFDFNKLTPLFPDARPRQHILTKVRNQDKDVVTKVTHGEADNYLVRDLAPGTIVELRFRAWYKRGEEYHDWDGLLAGVESDRGKVVRGSPEVSAVGRLLGFTE